MRKVALITGAARALGRAIAQDLASDHEIALTWRSRAPADPPPAAQLIQADLTEAGAPARVIAEVIGRFGRLDVIVNNAGTVVASPLDHFDANALQTMYGINVLAAQALLVAALPHLEPGAAIVNISSVNAALPPSGAVHYGASKAALEVWTRGVAQELGPKGIRINAVAPGAVLLDDAPRPPDMVAHILEDTALGRMASGYDIARAVRFLAGPDAVAITGEVLTVSGGYRL